MKLFVCLLLIAVAIEGYNCAPRTRSRHRHHHHQIGRPRARLLCRYHPYIRHHHGYQPMCDTYHPWRNPYHCTWHGSRLSYRHCSGYGYRHGYGHRHGFRPHFGYSSQYGKNNFIPYTTPMDKTEEMFSTVEPPTDNVVKKTSEGSMYMSIEKTIDAFSELPVEAVTGIPSVAVAVEMVTENASNKPVEVPVEMATEITEMLELTSTDITTGLPVEVTEDQTQMLEVEPTETTTEIPEPEKVTEDQTQMLEVESTEKTTEIPVDKSMEQSTLAITTDAAESVTTPQYIPEYQNYPFTYDELFEELKNHPNKNLTDKILLAFSDNYDNNDNNLSEYSTVNLFDDSHNTNLSEPSTESPYF